MPSSFLNPSNTNPSKKFRDAFASQAAEKNFPGE
jgi:hypothetical protein